MSTNGKTYTKIIWKVGNCTKESIKRDKVGKFFKSPVFQISLGSISTKWLLEFYPNGDNVKSKSHVGVFLCLVDSTSDLFDAHFKFTVKDLKVDAIAQDLRTGQEFNDNIGYGWSKFAKHSELPKEAGLQHGLEAIIVCCEMKLSVINEGEDTAVKQFDLSIYDYKKAFTNELFTDFELKTSDGETLKAHKVILVARSPMFYTMLTNDMTEAKDGYAKVPDFDSKIMKEVLRFIYYNEVKGLDEIAFDLVYAAEKYQLDGLKEICFESIIASLSFDNISNALIIADRLSKSDDLFDICVDFIISTNLTLSKCHHEALSKEFLLKLFGESRMRSQNTIYI